MGFFFFFNNADVENCGSFRGFGLIIIIIMMMMMMMIIIIIMIMIITSR